MSVATLESKRDLAIAALEAGDYADAIKYAMSAKLLLASMPNASRGAGGGSQSLAWNGSAIDDFITQCRQLATSAAVHFSFSRFKPTAS